jgi:hypothetical protein
MELPRALALITFPWSRSISLSVSISDDEGGSKEGGVETT